MEITVTDDKGTVLTVDQSDTVDRSDLDDEFDDERWEDPEHEDWDEPRVCTRKYLRILVGIINKFIY